MSTENDADMIATLSPEERLRLEDLAVLAVLRDANARREALNPEGYRIVREHAEACVAAVFGDPPMPLSREASEAVRAALAEAARGILRRED